jgi:ABC-type multidrug transport system fused ATPase/permease subunit
MADFLILLLAILAALVFVVVLNLLRAKVPTWIKVLLAWTIAGLLLYKYVILQWYLLNFNSLYLSAIAVLLFVSFCLAGSESAITQIASRSGGITDWQNATRRAEEKLTEKLTKLTGLKCCFIPFRKAWFYLFSSCPINFWCHGSDEVDIEDRVSFITICNNVININIVILLAKCLTQSTSFSNDANMPQFFARHGCTFLDWLPLAGDAGFSSVGVALIIVIVAELLPKQMALRNSEKFLRRFTVFLMPFRLLVVPELCTDGLADSIKRFVTRLKF